MKYLVEVHQDSSHKETPIPYHTVVEAIGEANAFTQAMEKYRKATGRPILFASSELEMVVSDFLWIADDGSSEWIEVREVS